MRIAALCASLLCACSIPGTPTLLPPPFGPDPSQPEAARFFFPTGIAMDTFGTSTTWVVVTNSNADRLYEGGAMYSLRAANLLQYFQGAPAGAVPFPTAALAGAAITGNYTGPLVLVGGTAYAGSRDTNRLNAVALNPATGALSCRRGAGVAAGGQDCRDSIDLNKAALVEGPFGMAAGTIHLPGTGGDVQAVMVSSLIPH